MKSIILAAFFALAIIGCNSPENSTGNDVSSPPATTDSMTTTPSTTDTVTTTPVDTTGRMPSQPMDTTAK